MSERSVDTSGAARRDLVRIAKYIASHDEDAAVRTVMSIEKRIDGLGFMPESYPLHPDLDGTIRFTPVGSYLILFQFDDAVVKVRRVLHGARDTPGRLADDPGDD